MLKVPNVQPEVIKEVHEALLLERRVTLRYKKRGEAAAKDYLLSPQALVIRQGVIYLVATAKDYNDLLHFALHRAVSAKLVETPALRLKSFDIDHYLETEKAFAYPRQKGATIRLKATIKTALCEHLAERPLSEDQVIQSGSDGAAVLTATVADTEDLRWWALGLGDSIQVLEPAQLRREMKSKLSSALASYA